LLSAFPGALIIAKWIDHNITLNGTAEKVKTKLDSMASRVANILQEKAASEEGGAPENVIKILEGIKHVMYEEEKFSGNTNDYYSINNSLINQVCNFGMSQFSKTTFFMKCILPISGQKCSHV